jgi:hypothetical protein
MCDYSLHAYANRLATEGENLILTRFPNGSAGFTSCEEFECQRAWKAQSTQQTGWASVKAFFRELFASKPAGALTAVCVPPGARLRLDGIPKSLQADFGVQETEEVTFTQLGFEAYTYRDAVRFNNGREVLIFRLPEYQKAKVLSLGNEKSPRGIEIPITEYAPAPSRG